MKDKIQVLDNFFSKLITKQPNKWINLIYNKDIEIIKDYVYPNSVNPLRPGQGRNGNKMPGGPKYIVIHDTGMTHEDDNADGLSRYIHNQADSETGRVASWHFSIDDKKIYNHVPTDEIAWHAGDGTRKYNETKYNDKSKKDDIGGGNQNGIGIETCINPGNDYILTLRRTAKLTADLLYKYNIDLSHVKQHYDFSSKFCPNVIKSTNGLWEHFLKDVEAHLLLNSFNKSVTIKWDVSNKNIISNNGTIITPTSDTKVKLKLTITIEDITKEYNYDIEIKGLTNKERIERTYFDLYHNIILNNNSSLPIENKKYQTTITWNNTNKLECTIEANQQKQSYIFDI